MVIRMRSTRSHTRNRRAHHALKKANFIKCPKCGQEIPPHRACFNCGEYKGRQAIDVLRKLNKKEKKKKEKELKAQAETEAKNKPLNAEELSK